MKEINGTITLAYVEEDNRQRVIFRVIPLCTREGSVFHGSAEDFPDEGSLRIVPDKREQSTFKERMREAGGLCAIQLASDGKELMKVRQNRNYAPEEGEKNQFAIYSDVICELTEDGCFEVVEPGTDASAALTAKVLLRKDKMLYGPVEKQQAQQAAVEELKPFGNDRFLLHTIETPSLGRHVIYWDPEATLNWRQRRNSLRRKERANAQEEEKPKKAKEKQPKEKAEALKEKPDAPKEKAEAPKEKAEAPAKADKPPKQAPHTRRVERAAEIARQEEERKAREAQAAERKETEAAVQAQAEEALPIGARLDILDAELPFEQQISRLAQPLSEGANRLTSDAPAPEEEEPQSVARFSGTPLSKMAGKITRSKSRPESMHHVVERQMRGQRDEIMGEELGSGTYGLVENPIENLRTCMEYVWQNADMRQQAMDMLLENEAFTADVAAALRRGGMNLHAAAAAQEQLAEIEADRLSLLMQLEAAKENEKKFREEALAALTQKRRDEAERLKREIEKLTGEREALLEQSRVLSSENAARITDFIAGQMNCLSGAGEQRVLLSPVMGRAYSQKELAEQLRVHMNDSGFSISDDEAVSLLISFSLYDALCFRARTLTDAQLFAQTLLESFGLKSVSATVWPGAYVEMISLLPEDAHRTPTVTVQPLGTETMTVFGHKTLFLADESVMPGEADRLLPYPVINVPAMLKRGFGRAAEWKPVAPASLESFAAIRADSHPMLSEAEKWFSDLKRVLSQAELVLPDAMAAGMRRFIEVASRKVRGGFLAAADMAASNWVAPLVMLSGCDAAKVADALAGLPRTLDLLGIR